MTGFLNHHLLNLDHISCLKQYLINCYILALPFFKNTLLSTILFSYIGFLSGKIYEKLPDGTCIVLKNLKKVIDHLGYNDPKKCDKCGREDRVKYSDFSKDKYDKPGQIEYDMNMSTCNINYYFI